ncbi:MAG: NUDIX domain-containing protein [Deltaproteobacteria bacterium]|nr:NUDIX domain-containing protein [Deltaproteobacteria bacterium]
MAQMRFCPQCGQRLISYTIEGRERPHCVPEQGGCGFIDFGHYSLGVGGIVMKRDTAAILLIQRNQEPNRGYWTLPGGFVESNETTDAAVVREVKEETGLHCVVVGLAGFRNRPDPDVNTSYVVFLLRIRGGQLIQETTEEIIQAGFYTLAQVQTMEQLTPLSRELAVAALTDRLRILHAITVPGLHGLPPVTLFMGDGE